MAPAGRGQQRARARFVYVTRFGSHQCGGVLQLGGPRAPGRGCPGPETCGGRQEPREAAAEAPSGGELPAGRAGSSRLRASSAPGRPGPAGVIQKDAAKKFDFPIPVSEASRIMKKRKKYGTEYTKSFLECLKKMKNTDSDWNARNYLVKTQITQDESSHHLLD